MKKILSAIIVIAMIAGLLSTNVVFAQSYNGVTYPNPISDYSPMNMREAASATSTKIGQVDMFEPIKILGREGDFFKVIACCTDLQEKTGYLSAGFVKELSIQFTVHGESDVEVRSFADNSSYKKHNIKANTNINVCFELNGWYYFLNDSIDSSNLNTGGFIRKDSVVNGEYIPPHIHSYTTKTEDAHPHREYKECACGEKEYTGNTMKVDNCVECYPKTDVDTEPDSEPTQSPEPTTKKEETNIPMVSAMKINGFSLPEKHTEGTKFDFEGNISSNTNISSVTVTIKPYSKPAITKTLTGNGKTFILSQFTKYFDFTKFDDLAYVITISATDELKTSDVFTGTFVLQTDETTIDVDTVFNNSLIYEFGSAVVFNNGKAFEMDAPMEVDSICNRTMIPIKALEWFYNGTVSWNKVENCAQAVIGDKTIKLKENERYMTVNGNKVEMDAAMYVKYDRTYVPLRAISELLGKNVYHIGGSNPVVITDYKIDSAVQNDTIAYAKSRFPSARRPSNIVLNGFSVPENLSYGKGYSIGGTITSTYPLVKVYVQIDGGNGFNYSKEGKLGKSFNMSDIDAYITFNTLDPGDKHIIVYAKDSIGSSVLVHDSWFTVHITPKRYLSGFNAPQNITLGNTYSIGGSVNSNTTITSVTIKVVNLDNNSIEINESAYVNSPSFNLKSIDNRIYFNYLTVGSKIIDIIVNDELGQETVGSYTFSVASAKSNQNTYIPESAVGTPSENNKQEFINWVNRMCNLWVKSAKDFSNYRRSVVDVANDFNNREIAEKLLGKSVIGLPTSIVTPSEWVGYGKDILLDGDLYLMVNTLITSKIMADEIQVTANRLLQLYNQSNPITNYETAYEIFVCYREMAANTAALQTLVRPILDKYAGYKTNSSAKAAMFYVFFESAAESVCGIFECDVIEVISTANEYANNANAIMNLIKDKSHANSEYNRVTNSWNDIVNGLLQ